jgi:hypothetical protein
VGVGRTRLVDDRPKAECVGVGRGVLGATGKDSRKRQGCASCGEGAASRPGPAAGAVRARAETRHPGAFSRPCLGVVGWPRLAGWAGLVDPGSCGAGLDHLVRIGLDCGGGYGLIGTGPRIG